MSQWHYTQKGQQVGPIDQSLLQGLISSGQVELTEMAWTTGMPSWQAVSSLPDLVNRMPAQLAIAGYGNADYSALLDQPVYNGAKAATLDYQAPQAPEPIAMGANAGFWLRVGAHLIDHVIIGIPFVGGLVFIFGTDSFSPGNHSIDSLMPFIKLASIVVLWLYYALQESSPHQATFGKHILGLRVADMNGHRISFMRASVRSFGKILSGMICSIGYVMAGFTEKKQGLHDMIAGTFVVTTWT